MISDANQLPEWLLYSIKDSLKEGFISRVQEWERTIQKITDLELPSFLGPDQELGMGDRLKGDFTRPHQTDYRPILIAHFVSKPRFYAELGLNTREIARQMGKDALDLFDTLNTFENRNLLQRVFFKDGDSDR